MNGGDRDVKKILLMSLSAMVAEISTFLIDMLKTRLQLHGESSQSAHPAFAYRTAFQIARKDGVLGMYKGLTHAIFVICSTQPVRFVGYEHWRNTFLRSSGDSPSFFSKAAFGGISGAVAQYYQMLLKEVVVE